MKPDLDAIQARCDAMAGPVVKCGADRDFTLHARTDLPALVTAYRAARDVVEAARGLLKYVHDKYPGEDLTCVHMRAIDATVDVLDAVLDQSAGEKEAGK